MTDAVTLGIRNDERSRWIALALPLVLLGILLVAMFVAAPGFERGESPPELSITYHTVPDDGTLVLHVTNSGAGELTVAQVMVNEAYTGFSLEKTSRIPLLGSGDGPNTLAPGESARIVIPQHLTLSPDNEMGVDVMLSGGETFAYEIEGVERTPEPGGDLFVTLGTIGLLVGVIPVAIGMLWFPAIRRMSDRWLFAILAFAAGVLGYLAVASLVEAFELAARIPGAYAGEAMVVLAAVGTLLLVQAISEWRRERRAPGTHGLWVAYLVAIGIGLHNLAEGLAIGSAYALGQLSLATFFILGFMLHNVTEGPAVVAPLANDASAARPALVHFVLLGLIAGAPVMLGGWLGGLVLSPTVGALFLAIGTGAILQVIWELTLLVRGDSGRAATSTNLLAFLVGAIVMYATGLLVVG